MLTTGFTFGNLHQRVTIIVSLMTIFGVHLRLFLKVTEYTYRIALGIEKFDIVHMEKLKLAKPPSPVALETRTTAMEDRPIVVESTTDNHHAIIDRPFVWVPPPQDEQRRPSRNRTPVKRLAYAENFAQTEQ